jgi:hypothetical protein
LLGFVASISICGHGEAKECGPTQVSVYRQESAGLPTEDWRGYYVFGLTPDGAQVLHFDPTSKRAIWLLDVTGGTNVPTRALVPESGSEGQSDKGLYRFLAARNDDSGEVMEALIVDMTVYWPTCAEREIVEKWKSSAGPPPTADKG